MNLILLAGNSPENEEWIEKVETSLGELFDITYVQRYEHWSSNKSVIDLEKELGKLTEEEEQLRPYAIFGKSAGVLLALKGMAEGKLKPKLNIFCGTPREFATRLGAAVDEWMEKLSTPTLFIQNYQDPAMHFEDLKDYLKEIGAQNYKLARLEGASHHYGKLKKIKSLTEKFIRESVSEELWVEDKEEKISQMEEELEEEEEEIWQEE